METEGSLPHSQLAATCPYPVPCTVREDNITQDMKKTRCQDTHSSHSGYGTMWEDCEQCTEPMGVVKGSQCID